MRGCTLFVYGGFCSSFACIGGIGSVGGVGGRFGCC